MLWRGRFMNSRITALVFFFLFLGTSKPAGKSLLSLVYLLYPLFFFFPDLLKMKPNARAYQIRHSRLPIINNAFFATL